MMLSLVPSFKLADQKTELIFIVDRSGSMMGKGIQQAKQALLLFLHSLPVDCYVSKKLIKLTLYLTLLFSIIKPQSLTLLDSVQLINHFSRRAKNMMESLFTSLNHMQQVRNF